MCLFSLHNDSTSKATASSPAPKRQTALCQLSPPTEDDRTIRKKGEEQSKANEEGNTCDISYKSVIEILLAKRGVLEEPADKRKYFLSIFFSPFHFGQVALRHSLCVFWSVPCHCRWLVDGLKQGVKAIMSLWSNYSFALFFSSFLITSPLHLSLSLSMHLLLHL